MLDSICCTIGQLLLYVRFLKFSLISYLIFIFLITVEPHLNPDGTEYRFDPACPPPFMNPAANVAPHHVQTAVPPSANMVYSAAVSHCSSGSVLKEILPFLCPWVSIQCMKSEYPDLVEIRWSECDFDLLLASLLLIPHNDFFARWHVFILVLCATSLFDCEMIFFSLQINENVKASFFELRPMMPYIYFQFC